MWAALLVIGTIAAWPIVRPARLRAARPPAPPACPRAAATARCRGTAGTHRSHTRARPAPPEAAQRHANGECFHANGQPDLQMHGCAGTHAAAREAEEHQRLDAEQERLVAAVKRLAELDHEQKARAEAEGRRGTRGGGRSRRWGWWPSWASSPGRSTRASARSQSSSAGRCCRQTLTPQPPPPAPALPQPFATRAPDADVGSQVQQRASTAGSAARQRAGANAPPSSVTRGVSPPGWQQLPTRHRGKQSMTNLPPAGMMVIVAVTPRDGR